MYLTPINPLPLSAKLSVFNFSFANATMEYPLSIVSLSPVELGMFGCITNIALT
jgi:hypothetical protein